MEAMTEITVEIDGRIHPRIIGGRGHNVKQIMTDFKVTMSDLRTVGILEALLNMPVVITKISLIFGYHFNCGLWLAE